MNKIAIVSAKLYESLLFAYPRHFRRRYGAEMASVFTETWCHAYQRYGLYGVLGVWFAAVGDLGYSACAEHVSTFVSTTRRDLLSISRAPMFAAASGALVGALFFIFSKFVRIDVYHDAVTFHQFRSIAIAVVNIALLWLTSESALRLLRCVLGEARLEHMPFVSRLRAFNHLATVSLVLALAAILHYVFFTARIPASGLRSLASPLQWYVFPVIVLCTVLTVIVLDPLLRLGSSISKTSDAKSAASTGRLRLSLGSNSEEDDL